MARTELVCAAKRGLLSLSAARRLGGDGVVINAAPAAASVPSRVGSAVS